MDCCGKNERIRRYYYKDEDILEELRRINDKSNKQNEEELKIIINLEKYTCKFNVATGTWKTEFKNQNEEYENEKKINEEIKNKKQQLQDAEIKCEELEKEFLAKTIRLLYMAQTHCDYKYENEQLFEKYGIKMGNKKVDLDKFLPDANKEPINKEKNKNGTNAQSNEEPNPA